MAPRETLNLIDISDASLRKNIFRELGGDLSREIKRGHCTDTPGSIARLMERAFKAGLALGADPEMTANRTDNLRPITEMDIPSLPRQQIRAVQRALGFDGYERRFYRDGPRAEGLVLIMRPKYPGMPSTISKDDWFCASAAEDVLSNKVVNPYVKLGLFAKPVETNGGWKFTLMTEWGFEMFTTGQTRGLQDRMPGTSSTNATYRELLGNDLSDLYRRAARAMGLVSDKPSPPSNSMKR